jgi:hypothetical protein
VAKGEEEIKNKEDYANDPQYAEPVIDSLKEQKMRELESLRDLMKRRNAESQSIKMHIIS